MEDLNINFEEYTALKAALFVDFDNAYLGLERLSRDVAKRFGDHPGQWLKWLINEFPSSLEEDLSESARRRVLIRRCYLNPVSFGHYRRPFLEAGFDIVDCPPMTAAGKTSTDVHMVLDMVDALLHPTGFEEFIVFSADADFSPVLRRLRTNNRRTVVFAAGNMSQAYRASADIHIDVDDFIYDGLGYSRPTEDEFHNPSQELKSPENGVFDKQREDISQETLQIVERSNEPVPFARLAADLNRRFGNLADSKWLGSGTFSNLLASLQLDKVVFDRSKQLAFDLSRMNQSRSGGESTPQEKTAAGEMEDIVFDAIERIRQEVTNSPSPTKFVRMASILIRQFPILKEGWLGKKNFSGFLSSLDLGDLCLAFPPESDERIIYDPARHAIRSGVINDPVIASIFQVAKLPEMHAVDFCRILNLLWVTFDPESFDIAASSSKIHAALGEDDSNSTISLSNLTSLLQGLIFGGFDPRRKYETIEDLKIDACGVILAAWARENLVSFVDNETRIQFMEWIDAGEPEAARLASHADVST